MSISFRNFLESAEILLNSPNSKEVDFRNLMSRSYYAMFHLSKEISETLSVTINNEEMTRLGSHEKIFIKFKKSSDKNLQRIADLMFASKENRVKADYHIDKTIVRKDAAHHFYLVKSVIQKLEQLNTNS